MPLRESEQAGGKGQSFRPERQRENRRHRLIFSFAKISTFFFFFPLSVIIIGLFSSAKFRRKTNTRGGEKSLFYYREGRYAGKDIP